MNFEKTKTLVFGERDPIRTLSINFNHLENVEQLAYLGCDTTYDMDYVKEVQTILAKATAVLKALENVWRSKNIEIETKKKVLQICVFSTLWM